MWAGTQAGTLARRGPTARYETSRCPPEGYTREGALRVVGRTMFETDRLDSEHVRRCNAMDEVWVPTAWSARVFAESGVAPGKIRVVPEVGRRAWGGVRI